MAPVPLNIDPVFRPWKQAGINYLLFDEATAAQLNRPLSKAQPVSPTQEPQNRKPVMPVRTDGLQEKRTGSAAREQLGQTPSGNVSPGKHQSEHSPSASVSNPAQAQQHLQMPRRLAPKHWPGYWQSLLERTPRSPEVVWTYPSLSRDLGGTADSAHRDFLRRLLGDMGMPRGTNAFWPLNVYPYPPDGGEDSIDASMFLSGVDVLDPDMVVLMCGKAPTELGLGGLGLLMPTIIRGRRFVVTPHVDNLILQPRRYAQLVTFLKGLITGH